MNTLLLLVVVAVATVLHTTGSPLPGAAAAEVALVVCESRAEY